MKKGYILPYTCILLGVFSIIVLLELKIALIERSESKFNEQYELKEKKEMTFKEFNFTYINKAIKENVKELSMDNIKKYLNTVGGSKLYSYAQSYVCYNKNTDCLSLSYQYSENIIKILQFKITETTSKINYLLVSIEYVDGRC